MNLFVYIWFQLVPSHSGHTVLIYKICPFLKVRDLENFVVLIS